MRLLGHVRFKSFLSLYKCERKKLWQEIFLNKISFSIWLGMHYQQHNGESRFLNIKTAPKDNLLVPPSTFNRYHIIDRYKSALNWIQNKVHEKMLFTSSWKSLAGDIKNVSIIHSFLPLPRCYQKQYAECGLIWQKYLYASMCAYQAGEFNVYTLFMALPKSSALIQFNFRLINFNMSVGFPGSDWFHHRWQY